MHSCNGCSFELEICYLPSIGVLRPNSQLRDTPPAKSVTKNRYQQTQDNTPKLGSASKKTTNNEELPLLNNDKNYTCVGIRRKRLKGDSWCYKKVCEEVLAFNTKKSILNLESAV